MAASGGDRVVDLHSTIRIGTDGVLTVTERIALEVEAAELRGGLPRVYPSEHQDRFGGRVSVPLEVLRVTRDGTPEDWALQALPGGERLRLGRADGALPKGLHTYEITYRTALQVGHFADHDELYWTLGGRGASLPVEHISAEVLLPAAVPATQLRAEAYTGPRGARGRDYNQLIRDGAVGFSSTAAFAPDEGMAIVVDFPKGVVQPPGFFTRVEWFFLQNKRTAAGLVVLALVCGFLLRRDLFRKSVSGTDLVP
jgi:hypothetical protein